MLLAALAIIAGFVVLVWSADRFVEGAAATAKHAGMPTLLIGMVIVGFGTSAPEMVVSAIAALDGSPGLALGNAYGSNIANTGLILGLSALIIPLTVHSKIVRKELPLLLAITLLGGAFLWNGKLERWEAVILLMGFFALIGWSVFSALRNKGDQLEGEVAGELEEHSMPLGRAIFWVVAGLALLIISSRMLVWGAVTIAESLGVSDLVIGLTIVALGTSLPELAATIVAARKGEHDIAIGNVVGSNMFNLLAVVGIAGTIAPMSSVPPEVLSRDWPMVIGLTIALFIFAYGFRGQGRINRWEGAALLTAYLVYTGYLTVTITKAAL
ncbi:inner membrane protein YrbG [Microbulbifer sp. NBRC 101763]|uniref:calcium/sodium antiporter n=1 Tax=Microbulbifer TaxID=48073 RepID=UPI0003805472|nr:MULTISPECIES: calcium/sodium antiporter [Microbulbifer]WHI51147.1 calcium/sodium antiporter [Microbulbifer sp. MLAF003]